ncbi:MAG: FG-GAP-like repeat-containing protein [bacterium]
MFSSPIVARATRVFCVSFVLPGLGGLALLTLPTLAYTKPGAVLSTVEINDSSHDPSLLRDNDLFGVSVGSLGDLDGNGVPDLAVGASGDDTGGARAGAVYLEYMSADLSPSAVIKIDVDTDNGPALSSGDQYGNAVAGPGDVNSDGVPDLVVGAPLDDTQGVTRGAVYLHFLRADGSIKSSVKFASGSIPGVSLPDNARYGSSLGALGDFDGDGVPDLAVGVPGLAGQEPGEGGVLLHLLQVNGAVKQTVSLDSTVENGASVAAEDHYGSSIAALGDLDGDNVVDIAVGAPGDDTGGSDRGAVYVHLMAADGGVRQTVKVTGQTRFGPELEDRDALGSALSTIPDLDGDGVPELVAATRPGPKNSFRAGKVFILFLNKQGQVKSTHQIDPDVEAAITVSNYDRFGDSVTYMGDVNEDGLPELVVGADGDDEGGPQKGAVHLVTLDNNHDPVIRGGDRVTVTEGSLRVRRIDTVDADGNTVHLALTGGEDLARFTLGADNVLSFARAPDYDIPGDRNRDNIYKVEVTAKDDRGGEDRKLYSVYIGNTNEPPLLSGNPPLTVLEGRSYSFTPNASDPENQTLIFTARRLPEWLTIDRDTGLVSGVPGRFDIGVFTGVVINALDYGGQSTRLPAFDLTVVEVNAAPTFVAGGDVEASLDNLDGNIVTIAAWASDISDGDRGLQALNFEILENLNPSIFESEPGIDPASGDLSFIPRSSGESSLVVQLLDDGGTARGGISSSNSVAFTVRIPDDVVAAIQEEEGEGGGAATDPEGTNSGDISPEGDNPTDDANVLDGSGGVGSQGSPSSDSGGGATGFWWLLSLMALMTLMRSALRSASRNESNR